MGECLRNAPPPWFARTRRRDPASHASFQRPCRLCSPRRQRWACDGYATEKVWMALSRGSVPLYWVRTTCTTCPTATPSSTCEVRLGRRGREKASRHRDGRFGGAMRRGRFRDPSVAAWISRAARATSTDVKYGVCDVLMKGPRGTGRRGSGRGRLGATRLWGSGGSSEGARGMGGGYARGASRWGAQGADGHLHRRCGAATGVLVVVASGEGGKGGKRTLVDVANTRAFTISRRS